MKILGRTKHREERYGILLLVMFELRQGKIIHLLSSLSLSFVSCFENY